jgi:shikimate kinase
MANVVLTGFMGTGKTTVGRLLADRLGYEFVDTDTVIEERHGSIPQIFAAHGEPRFRRYEREVAAELAARDGLVISTGGRLMLDPVNVKALGAGAHVFCLTASLDTILARVTAAGVADERPLLAGPDVEERIARLLEARAGAYAEFAQIATDLRTPEAVAEELAGRCRPDE